jgi:hypothetical protein
MKKFKRRDTEGEPELGRVAERFYEENAGREIENRGKPE